MARDVTKRRSQSPHDYPAYDYHDYPISQLAMTPVLLLPLTIIRDTCVHTSGIRPGHRKGSRATIHKLGTNGGNVRVRVSCARLTHPT